MNNYLLKNANLYINNDFIQTDILVCNGYIQEIAPSIESNVCTLDLKGKLVSHNFIDIHTHLREPGFEHKETIKSGTKAALYGGYGTVVAMANTLPCMDDDIAITDFIKRVAKDAYTNVYTYSAITQELRGKQLVDIHRNSQFDIVQGFSDDGKGVQSNQMMDLAMKEVAKIDSIIVAHCEDESELTGGCVHEGEYAREHNLVGINNASEYKQVARDLKLVEKYHNRYHVCHISTKETVQLIKNAKEKGMRVSGEASPHHLILTDENIKDCHPNYKMNPPLRSKDDLHALIEGLKTGVITTIATDHAPHAREEKNKSIQEAPFGIIGIQQAFPLLYTYLVKKDILDLKTVLNALTIGPAKVLGLNAHIRIGALANLCIFDLEDTFQINEENNQSKSVNTPFLGVTCYAKIVGNSVNGNLTLMEDI